MAQKQPEVSKVEAFWQSLQARQEAEDCESCLESLEKYVRYQLETHEVVKTMPKVAAHLSRCVLCSRSYVRVYETIWGNRHGTHTAVPPSEPDFAMDIDDSDPQTAVSSRVNQLVQREPGKVELHFTGDLVRMLHPRTGMLTVRQPGDSARYSEAIIQMKPLAAIGMPVALTAYRDAQQERLCMIEVIVVPPGENWPHLGGKQVQLTVAGRSETNFTDDWGVTHFVDIPVSQLPTLHLEVTLASR